jgi:hypothetical protein
MMHVCVAEEGSGDVLKLFLQADRKSAQTLRQHLPPIIDGVEALAPDDHADPRLARSARDPAEARPAQYLTIGVVMSGAEDISPERIKVVQARFPGPLEADSVFLLPPRATDFTGFESWCAARVRTMLDFLLSEYAAGQLATAGLRRHTEQLERSLAQAEAIFAEFRRQPLKLAYRAERAGTHALPLLWSEGGGPRSLEIRQTLRRQIANIRYIDVFFNGEGRNLEGTARFIARAAWSGKLLCDASVDLKDLGRSWTQFRCDPLDSGDEEPLAIELDLSGPDLGWLVPAFSHACPLPEDCATIVGHSPIGRPLAMQIWSGIPGIEPPAHTVASGEIEGAGPANVISIAPEQLGTAELVSKVPADLTFMPVSYDTATQSLLVHPLGPRPTVAVLPSRWVANLSSLSAIVQVPDAGAQPTEFAMLALPSSGWGRGSDAAEDVDLAAATWHEFKAREWGEIELNFPRPLDGEVRIYLLTRTRSDNYNYTSAFFRGLKMTCGASGDADRPRE